MRVSELLLDEDIGDFLLDDAAVELRLAHRAEGDPASREREERMIVTDTDIFSGFNLGPALTDYDHPRSSRSAVGELNAEVFWV